jgi:hypothetical protein
MAYRKVPKKIIITGDIDRGKTYIGQADSQLNILQNQMRFQNLKQGWRTVKLADDVVVECWSCFSLSAVRIHVVPAGPEVEKLEEEKKKCLCFPCFAFGVIEEITTEYNTQQLENGYRYYYNVSVCDDDTYVLFENYSIKSAGWERYHAGQYVLVSVDAANPADVFPDCCKDSDCLVSDRTDDEKMYEAFLIIAPFFIKEEMVEWRKSLTQ